MRREWKRKEAARVVRKLNRIRERDRDYWEEIERKHNEQTRANRQCKDDD